jgi:hypothetical protein
MVKIEFFNDENEINEDKLYDPLHMDAAILEQTFFVLPVRFLVNDSDMFHWKQEIRIGMPKDEVYRSMEENIYIWIPLPVLHLATKGLDEAKRACKGETIIYSLPGTMYQIKFHPMNNKIEISSSFLNYSEVIYCTELVEAFEKFAEEVRKMINREFPELKKHPQIGAWLLQTAFN